MFSRKVVLMLFFVLWGLFYYFFTQVHINGIKRHSLDSMVFSFHVHSKIDQNVKLHIAADRTKIHWVECNKEKITFTYKKMQWFEGLGEQVFVPLYNGDNICKVKMYSAVKNHRFVVKRKITFFDYTVLFILFGIPLFSLMFYAFMWVLDKIRKHFHYDEQINSKSLVVDLDSTGNKNGWALKLFYGILFAGVVLRLLYFNKFGIMLFQHDWHGHIEFIKYIAENWTLPLPSKGLEYPQQPLYYLVTGGLYALFRHFGLNEQDALYGLGFFSLFCSMVFLYYSYRLMTLMSQNIWVRTVAMVFVSLTPSLIYMSARINNDVLVMALSAFSLYYSVKSYQNGFKTGFYTALTGVSLLFLTKISAAPVELLLFALLLVSYMKAEEGNTSMVRKALYLFGLVGLFLLGFTLLKVYLPVESTFHMVNSSGYFPRQHIETFGMDYFGTFNLPALVHTGYSYIFGDDAIRFSFLSYQYGTMFFGEFDYAYFLGKSTYLHLAMQSVLVLGLLFPLGFMLFAVRSYRLPLLDKLLFATLLLNFLLILKFMFAYPSICNTDFRYFVGSLVLLALVFAKGLEPLYNKKLMGTILKIWITLLAGCEIFFLIFLIMA